MIEPLAPKSVRERVPGSVQETADCAAIVLAAGASSRLGQPKQLLLYRGEPLLRRTVKMALAVEASPVLVILGAYFMECQAVLVDLPVTIVENPDHQAGMGSGLRLGMATLAALKPGPERVLLLVCDQPLLQTSHVRQLLRTPAAGGIAAAAYGGRAAVPAVFGKEHFPALAATTGDQGARTLLRTLPVTQVPMPEAAVDIDTPEDLLTIANSSSQGTSGRN